MMSTTQSPPYFLITSSGPTADHQGNMLGLYRKTEQMTEGRSEYIQLHEAKYGGIPPCKLYSSKGLWVVTRNGTEWLRAVTPSDGPTSVKWQFFDYNTWRDDPALAVTGLSEKPSVCEVTISLSQDILRDIKDPGVAGVYTSEGSYRWGRPVLQHSGGLFTLSVYRGGCWWLEDGVGGAPYLYSESAPSQCPADPRAARNEKLGWTHWRYRSKWGGYNGISSGIIGNCDKCINVADASTKIQGLESTVKTLKAEIEKLCSLNVTLEGSIAEYRAESADWMKKYENKNCLRTEETDALKRKMTEEVNEITGKLLNSERFNADLATHLKEMTDLYENSERSNADIATKLKEMTNLYKKADRDGKEHANEIVKISCEAGRLKMASKTLTNDKGVLIDEVKSTKIDLDALKKRISNMDEDMDRAEKAWSAINQLRSKENVFTAASVSVKETEVVVKNTINKIDVGSAKSAN